MNAGVWLLVLRLAVAALFLYAGAAKAPDPGRFATELANYRLLPATAVPALAYYLPWLELVAAGALFSGRLRPGAWLVLAALAAGFAVFVTSAWIRGLDVTCGCFGGGGRPIDGVVVLRTSLVLAATGAGLLRDHPKRPSPPPGAGRT